MLMENKLQKTKIGDTPLSISIYSVTSSPTHINDPDILEIVLCLKGCVNFSCGYDDFTLMPGEYVVVDRDAFFLYKGRDNICVSFFLDLSRYEDRYPYIKHQFFVCEGTAETDDKNYNSQKYILMKGLLIATLKYILKNDSVEKIQLITDRIVELLIKQFDIAFYFYGSNDISSANLDKLHLISQYFSEHFQDKIDIHLLADELGHSPRYLLEFMRKYSLGLRDMLGYFRANISERYLINTDKTVSEISAECGFSDIKYYYSTFKKWYHCTPGRFRERYCHMTDLEIEYLPKDDIAVLVDSILSQHYLYLFTDSSFNNY